MASLTFSQIDPSLISVSHDSFNSVNSARNVFFKYGSKILIAKPSAPLDSVSEIKHEFNGQVSKPSMLLSYGEDGVRDPKLTADIEHLNGPIYEKLVQLVCERGFIKDSDGKSTPDFVKTILKPIVERSFKKDKNKNFTDEQHAPTMKAKFQFLTLAKDKVDNTKLQTYGNNPLVVDQNNKPINVSLSNLHTVVPPRSTVDPYLQFTGLYIKENVKTTMVNKKPVRETIYECTYGWKVITIKRCSKGESGMPSFNFGNNDFDLASSTQEAKDALANLNNPEPVYSEFEEEEEEEEE